jgi:RNA polymerase sigma factor (sigma-70 family)
MSGKQNLHDESLLWNDFLSGNNAAYSLIYKNYFGNLFVQGLQFTGDKELIRDCIHDVFVKIYMNRTTLGPVDNVKVYLFTALRNSILTALKKAGRHSGTLDGLSECVITRAVTIEEEYIDKEHETQRQQLINKIFSLLPARQREAVHYRFFEGMSLDQIGVLMGMNYQSVQNLLQRALKKINKYAKIVKKK